MKEEPVVYYSYLLRMWRTGNEGRWRVSLEDPRTGERVGFSDLNALLSHLLRQIQERDPLPTAGGAEAEDAEIEADQCDDTVTQALKSPCDDLAGDQV